MNLTGGHSKAESEPELDLGHFPGFNSDEDDEYVPPQPAAGLRQPRGVKRHFPKREPFSDDMIDPQLKRVKLECDMKPEPAQKAKSAATAGEMKAREVSTILQDSYKEPINLTSDFSKTEFELSLNLAHCPDVALDEDNGAESPRPSMGPSQPREVRRQVPPKREPFPDDMIDPEFKRVKRACDMQPEPVPKEESARAAPASSTNNHTFRLVPILSKRKTSLFLTAFSALVVHPKGCASLSNCLLATRESSAPTVSANWLSRN